MEWEPPLSRDHVSDHLFDDAHALTADYEKFWTTVERNNMDARRQVRKPLIRSMMGRAKQLQPRVKTWQRVPLKTSRPGDRLPHFLGSSLQHAQWTKQLRRLQSLIRLCATGIPSHEHYRHLLQLWNPSGQLKVFNRLLLNGGHPVL